MHRHLLLLLVWVLALAPAALAQSAREIFEEVERRQRLVHNERAEIEMRIEDARGRTRSRSMTVYTRVGDDDRQRSLLVFTAPADIRGTGLLTVETASGDDQRLYLPALDRVQRVAGAQRTERFAGSDFTYEDLGTRNPDDYDVAMIETRRDAYVLEATPRERHSQYGRIVLEIDRGRYVVLRADHYDRRGTLAKRLTADEFREVAPGTYRSSRMVMEDVQNDRRTVLRFVAREILPRLPDDVFTERRLRRGAG